MPENPRKTARIPVVTNKHITEFNTGSTASEQDTTQIYNGIVDKYQGDANRTYVTTRPGVTLVESGVSGEGRGIYYWGNGSNRGYIMVVGDRVYRNDYVGPLPDGQLTGTLTSSTGKVSFIEWKLGNSEYLFIVDTYGAVYYLEGITNTVNTITQGVSGSTVQGDAYNFNAFPAPAGEVPVLGAVDLDDYLFIAFSDNYIYNSEAGDFLDWSTERKVKVSTVEDDLVGIVRTNNHIAALGTRSVEFFYNVQDPTLSVPIAPRQDIFYNIGAVDHQRGSTFWSEGDDVYFLSTKPSGDFSLSVIKDLKVTEIPNSTFDSLLQHGREIDDIRPTVAGFSTGGHTYCIISLRPGSGSPLNAIVYDTYSNLWYDWLSEIENPPLFSVADYTFNDPTTPAPPRGMFANGTTFTILNDLKPVDNNGSDILITPEVLLGNIEFDTADSKFMHSLNVVTQATLNTTAIINISWSDDAGTTFTTPVPINVLDGEQVNKLGKFSRRQFKLTWDDTTDTALRVEALEVTYTQGDI